jgi:hypothetical protein
MLAWPKALIASALRMLADRYATGRDDVRDLDDRYSNAICRSVDPMTRDERDAELTR